MKPYQLFTADCRDVMSLCLDDNSIDAIVTDPPYEWGFMGKSWDATGIANNAEVWSECLRVLKPGGHLLAFGGSRTYHRMTCAIEDAGFEIRDCVMWLYGSGFPKSLDVSKAIDRAAGAVRAGTGEIVRGGGRAARGGAEFVGSKPIEALKWKEVTAPATDDAHQWQGWGTALKPAHEPIVVARKPLIGTVAQNVLKHGTGAINIDGCRVQTDDVMGGSGNRPLAYAGTNHRPYHDREPRGPTQQHDAGRWPANVIHDGSAEVLAGFPNVHGAGKARTAEQGSHSGPSGMFGLGEPAMRFGDTGSAARFFYCAKSSKSDRGVGNIHATVKPSALMSYLCRLVTPPGGVILDPFMGSGSTGKAAMREGFRFIGIDMIEEYVAIATARIEHALTLDLLK